MEHWEQVLSDHWGIKAQFRKLDGEYDLNFLAETNSEAAYVVKVMRAGCDEWLVDMQVKAMEHIQTIDPTIPTPKVIKTSYG